MKTPRVLFLSAALALALTGCAGTPKDAVPLPTTSADVSAVVDLPQLAMAGGVLYYNTGEESTQQGRCGTPDGTLSQEVAANQFPTEDGQCNFGSGFGYQNIGDHIEVHMDNRWIIFRPYEG